jgi:hypothetical protein
MTTVHLCMAIYAQWSDGAVDTMHESTRRARSTSKGIGGVGCLGTAVIACADRPQRGDPKRLLHTSHPSER